MYRTSSQYKAPVICVGYGGALQLHYKKSVHVFRRMANGSPWLRIWGNWECGGQSERGLANESKIKGTSKGSPGPPMWKNRECGARVNQHPPLHQLAILSIGWVMFFHPASDLALTKIVPHSTILACWPFDVFSWMVFFGNLDLHTTLSLTYLPTYLPIYLSIFFSFFFFI
jgi:hypothetical protein